MMGNDGPVMHAPHDDDARDGQLHRKIDDMNGALGLISSDHRPNAVEL
jgi:hypothetical protein